MWPRRSTFKMRVFPLESQARKTHPSLSYTQKLPEQSGITRYRFRRRLNMRACVIGRLKACQERPRLERLEPSHAD